MLNRAEALKAITNMKGAKSPLDYITSLGTVAPVSGNSDLPVKLDEAHTELTQSRALLSEAALDKAKMTVAISVDRDASAIKTLAESGKLTVPVANKLVLLCEGKRADQLVLLAEGDMPGASNADAEVQQILEMLGELPQAVSTGAPADPAAGAAPIPEPDPTGAGAPQGSIDDQIDALAQEIMAKTPGMSYEQAAMQAAQQLQSAAPQQGGLV